jgi:hypothetical protein
MCVPKQPNVLASPAMKPLPINKLGLQTDRFTNICLSGRSSRSFLPALQLALSCTLLPYCSHCDRCNSRCFTAKQLVAALPQLRLVCTDPIAAAAECMMYQHSSSCHVSCCCCYCFCCRQHLNPQSGLLPAAPALLPAVLVIAAPATAAASAAASNFPVVLDSPTVVCCLLLLLHCSP